MNHFSSPFLGQIDQWHEKEKVDALFLSDATKKWPIKINDEISFSCSNSHAIQTPHRVGVSVALETPHGAGVSEPLFVVVMVGKTLTLTVHCPPCSQIPSHCPACTSTLTHIVSGRGFSHSSAGSLWWRWLATPPAPLLFLLPQSCSQMFPCLTLSSSPPHEREGFLSHLCCLISYPLGTTK